MIQRHIPTKIMHRAVEHGGVIYLAGIVADDLSQDMQGQTAQICEKIAQLLKDCGSSKEKLLMASIYITDFAQKDGMNAAWIDWLAADHLPSRATIGVDELGKGVLIEVVVTAAK